MTDTNPGDATASPPVPSPEPTAPAGGAEGGDTPEGGDEASLRQARDTLQATLDDMDREEREAADAV